MSFVRGINSMVRQGRGTHTLERESDEVGGIREQVSIQFTGSPPERDTNFGEFCVALTNASIPFTIAGDRTLIISKEMVESVYSEPHWLYERYLKREQIKVESVSVTGNRLRKSRDEAKAIARWYMQNR
jgi:hypothetical protein